MDRTCTGFLLAKRIVHTFFLECIQYELGEGFMIECAAVGGFTAQAGSGHNRSACQPAGVAFPSLDRHFCVFFGETVKVKDIIDRHCAKC